MMTFNRNDPSTWPDMKPTIIAHDVARSHDRSTAVVGGLSYYQPSTTVALSVLCGLCGLRPDVRVARWTMR